MPQDGDQIVPFAKLGKELRPDYAIIKHCTDNEDGDLRVDYNAYEKLYPSLKEAEKFSDEDYKVVIKWSNKIKEIKIEFIKDVTVRRFLYKFLVPALLLHAGHYLTKNIKISHW